MKPKLLKITLAIAVLVFVAAGYLFLSGKTGQTKEPTEKVANNTVSTNETNNWKTYRNEEYGFEFKYPNSLIAENYGTGSDEIIVGIALSTKGADFQIPFVELEIIPQPVKFLINDSIERLTDVKTYKAIVNQEINIGGLKGKEIGNGGSSDTEYSVYREIFVGLKENKSLFIKYVGLEKTTLDTLLSTFKFID